MDAGRVAAVAVPEDGVAPMDVAENLAVGEASGLEHPVAAVPHVVPESPAAPTAPATESAGSLVAAAASSESALEQAHEVTVHDARERYA